METKAWLYVLMHNCWRHRANNIAARYRIFVPEVFPNYHIIYISLMASLQAKWEIEIIPPQIRNAFHHSLLAVETK